MQDETSRPPDEIPAAIIDARGYRCPMPVILMEKALRGLAFGGTVRIVADDPLSAIDIPHFAGAAGARTVRLPDQDGACVFLVTRAGNRAE
ncbi:MAG: sulfurtransferase TusA family protein [Parvularculaceae bacterium]